MSWSIEPLPSRLYFAAGPDPSFGKNGVATVGGTGAVTQSVLGVGGVVYVFQTGGTASYVTRLNTDGTPDSDWGTAGRAAVPFGSVDRMAYDKRLNDLVILGGEGTRFTTHTTALQVLKLNAADGSRVATFGDEGLAEYVPTPPAGHGNGAAVNAETVTVLPHGGLLVGMKVTGYDNISGSASAQTIDSTLLRLNAAGKKQLDFGHRGTKAVASGMSTYDTEQTQVGTEYTQTDDIPSFGDVRALADGGFKVVLLRSDRTETENASDYMATTDVLTRTVNTRGLIVKADDASWRIYDAAQANADAGDHFAAAAFATDDGVTALAFGPTIGTRAFVLGPGHAARSRQVVLPSNTPDFVRSNTRTNAIATRAGYTVFGRAAAGGGLVQVALELTPDFKSDAAWGDRGVLSIDTSAGNSVPTLDDSGRVLAFDGTRVERFTVT